MPPQEPMQPPVQTAQAKDYTALYIPGAIVVSGALIAAGVFFGLSKGGGTQQVAGAAAPQQVDVKNVKIGDNPFMGKADAPLTMAYWSDYQCPFCKAVEVGGVQGINVQPSIPTLIKDYVNTGKLKIVFKDFVFLGQDSITAAEYEHAIWKLYPDKFYTWRDAMYKAQDAEGDQGFGKASTIDALIKKIPGLDDAKIKADIAANKAKYDAEMQADTQEAQGFGIQGTPGFIIGTKSIDGAQPLENFKAAIDSQL